MGGGAGGGEGVGDEVGGGGDGSAEGDGLGGGPPEVVGLGVDVLAEGWGEGVEHVEAGLAAFAGGEDGLAAEGGQFVGEGFQVGLLGVDVAVGVAGAGIGCRVP